MWDRLHLKGEGWLKHTVRSVKFTVLLLLSGMAMAVHALVPFLQQPKFLRARSVADYLHKEMDKRE
jgi:hypothetical protein